MLFLSLHFFFNFFGSPEISTWGGSVKFTTASAQIADYIVRPAASAPQDFQGLSPDVAQSVGCQNIHVTEKMDNRSPTAKEGWAGVVDYGVGVAYRVNANDCQDDSNDEYEGLHDATIIRFTKSLTASKALDTAPSVTPVRLNVLPGWSSDIEECGWNLLDWSWEVAVSRK